MKKWFFVFFLPVFFVASADGQEPVAPKHEVRGTIRDQNSTVFPGLRLSFKSGTVEKNDFTDINGEFRSWLPDGDFVLTAATLSPDKFRVFIKLSENGLNPGYLDIIISSDTVICGGERGNPSPKIISSADPPYPPAARAVRAGGQVTVIGKVGQDGKVLSAKAIGGHPLLQRASEAAAEKFIFESAAGITERDVILTFVFLPDQEIKESVKRHSCPYRIIVYSVPNYIYTTDSIDPPSRRGLFYGLRHFLHF